MTIYYGAADYGYELVAELDDENARDDYGFTILAVWRRLSDGALYWAQDSGCSCPSPFEDYSPSGEWLSPLAKTWAEFAGVLRDFNAPPPDKIPFWRMRPFFGASVVVTTSGVERV